MKSKSAYVVLSVGAIFLICSICRLFGYLFPSIVVALISVIAALVSLSDVLEITRFKKYGIYVQLTALLFFILSMTLWLLPINLNFPLAQSIGDSFTLLGLGLVIGLFGLKEILEHNNKKVIHKPNETLKKCKYNITLNEYEEMMKLNDIIERLKKLDQDVFPYNKVHNGWAFFSDSLVEHWNAWRGPFFDGINREKYYEFLSELDRVSGEIGDITDTDYCLFSHRKIEMWNEDIEITIQPRINNMYLASIKDIAEELDKAISLWAKVKEQVTKRYEKQRSEQKKIV
ncbi:APC family permease [Bacillus sp. T17B1]|uniref:APC family permease n=1 Tax=Bacillus sp. T17B1 TaxID=2918911 RepID=UPI0022803094|nr:APC family permease [Bacillus sp. T17B1]